MKLAVKLLIGVMLLSLLLWRLDVRAIIDALSLYRVSYLILAILVFFVAWGIATLRWRIFVPQFSFATLFRLSFVGQFYSMLLPGQIAGEGVKAYRLAKGQLHAVPLVSSVLIDRVIGVFALLLIGDIGLLTSSRVQGRTLLTFFVGLSLFVCILLLALRVHRLYRLAMRYVDRWQGSSGHKSRLAALVGNLISVWRGYTFQPAKLLMSFVLAVIFQVLVIALYLILAWNLGIDVALMDWLWIVGVVSLAVLLPVSVAGIGLREGALVGSLGYLGVVGEQAIALSVGIFALMLLGAIIGWVFDVSTPSASRIN